MTTYDLSLPPHSFVPARTEAQFEANPLTFDIWPLLQGLIDDLEQYDDEVIRGVRFELPPGIMGLSRPIVPGNHQITIAGPGRRNCEIRGLYPGGWLIDAEDPETAGAAFDTWHATGIAAEPWALVLGAETLQQLNGRHFNWGVESDFFSLAPSPGDAYAQDAFFICMVIALESINVPGEHGSIWTSGGGAHIGAPHTEAYRITCINGNVIFAVTTETGDVISASTGALTLGTEYFVVFGYFDGEIKIWLGPPGGTCNVVNSDTGAGSFVKEELWHLIQLGAQTQYFPGSTIHRFAQHCRVRSLGFGKHLPFASWATASFTAPQVLQNTNPFPAGKLDIKMVFANAALDNQGRPEDQTCGRIGETNFVAFNTLAPTGISSTKSTISRFRCIATSSHAVRFRLEGISFRSDGARGRGSGCVYMHNNVGGSVEGCSFSGLNGLFLGHDGYDFEVSRNEFACYMTGLAAFNNAFGRSCLNRFTGGYLPISTWGFWTHEQLHTDVAHAAYAQGVFCCEGGRYSAITCTNCTFGHESSIEPFAHGVVVYGNGSFQFTNCDFHLANHGTHTWESAIYVFGSETKSITVNGGWIAFWGDPPSGTQYLIEFQSAPTSVIARFTGVVLQITNTTSDWTWSNHNQFVKVDGRPAPHVLFDANATVAIANGRAFEVRPIPLTANRDYTLSATGAQDGDRVWFANRDTSAFAARIVGAAVIGAPVTIPQGKRIPMDFAGGSWSRGPGTEMI